MYKRKKYEYIKDVMLNGAIPIIVGHRRVGKTTILEQLSEEFEKSILIDFDDPVLKTKSGAEVFQYLEGLINDGYKTLLLDEIQEIETWDNIVKKLFDYYVKKKTIHVAVTGSSSLSFSKRDTGVDRTEIIMLGTLTFSEYIELTKKEKNFQNFETFMELGGFPYYALNDIEVKIQKKKVLWPILSSDIPKEYGIKNMNIEKLLLNIASNTNGEFNREQHSQRTGSPRVQIDDYIDILEQSLIIKRVYKLDENGTQQKYSKYKIYINPHFHLWLLNKNWETVDEKFKGHLIESYWIFAHLQEEGLHQTYYYIKDKFNNEVDLAFPEYGSKDFDFEKIIEFKYTNKTTDRFFPVMEKIKSRSREIICKENGRTGMITFKNIIDEF